VLRGFNRNPQDFVFYTKVEKYRNTTDEYLCISPVRPSKWLIDTILQGRKVILMSATLLKSDMWDLGIREFKYLDMPSPIPKENRPIVYLPHTEAMNYKTPEASIAKYIHGVLDKYPNRNTVVHLSYGWADRIRKYFPEALYNTSETKVKVLQQFKQKGGLWLAAGCAEGIDLPDEECRLTIIPMVIRANPHDPVTKKQIALQGGYLAYELHAIKTLIQQAGRGTRGLDDHSITVIGDNSFPRLIIKNKQYVPKSFNDAIVWRNK
jgi:Rad3-related DNA helicase